jgi:hypothetical protein
MAKRKTYHEFMMSVLTSKKPGGVRFGQHAYNMLSDVNPELATNIVEPGNQPLVDPYHNDDNLPAFWAFVAKNWDAS